IQRKQSGVVLADASAAPAQRSYLAIQSFDFRNQLLVLAGNPAALDSKPLELLPGFVRFCFESEVRFFQSRASVFSGSKRVLEIANALADRVVLAAQHQNGHVQCGVVFLLGGKSSPQLLTLGVAFGQLVHQPRARLIYLSESGMNSREPILEIGVLFQNPRVRCFGISRRWRSDGLRMIWALRPVSELSLAFHLKLGHLARELGHGVFEFLLALGRRGTFRG